MNSCGHTLYSFGEAALRKIISRWYRDHWIEKTDKGHWKKLSVEK